MAPISARAAIQKACPNGMASLPSLCEAERCGSIGSTGFAELEELIRNRADVNQAYMDARGMNLRPLGHAVALKSPQSHQLIKRLCQARADLSYAVGAANDEVMALAQYPECLRAQGVTAGIMERLAKAGAEINFAFELGRTALHLYAVQGQEDVVLVLIEHDAHLDKKDQEGKTPLQLAIEAEAPEELLMLLDYVELYIGLTGKHEILRTSVLSQQTDLLSFLKHHVRNMLQEDWRLSYFSIQVTVGNQILRGITSWQALGRPKTFFITLSCNFRQDPLLAKAFLRVAAQKGDDADLELQDHLEDYQDPDVDGQTVAGLSKAAATDPDGEDRAETAV